MYTDIHDPNAMHAPSVSGRIYEPSNFIPPENLATLISFTLHATNRTGVHIKDREWDIHTFQIHVNTNTTQRDAYNLDLNVHH